MYRRVAILIKPNLTVLSPCASLLGPDMMSCVRMTTFNLRSSCFRMGHNFELVCVSTSRKISSSYHTHKDKVISKEVVL